MPAGPGLRRVRRDPDDGSAGTPVTLATFVYGVPTSGAGLPAVNAATTGWVRPHTHTDYDQGAPNSGMNPATGLPYRLPTKVSVGVADSTAATSNPTATLPADRETISRTFTGYSVAGSPVAGDPDTWALGLPTTQTVDLDGTHSVTSADITTTTRYDTEGKIIERRKPASSGSEAGTLRTIHYRAGTGSGEAQCDSKPQWAGRLCRVSPAAAPNSGPAMPDLRNTGFTYLLAPTTVVETSGTTTRTTSTTYLTDGRVDTVVTTASGLTGSTAMPALAKTYDPATGLQTRTSVSGSDYNHTGYDAWGRTTSYRNSLGETTTTTYIPIGSPGAGSVATVTDPKGAATYGYGNDATGAVERRRGPTSVTVSGIGTFTGAYDANGALIRQDMPGGLRQNTSYDTAGEPVGLSYTGEVVDPDTGAVGTGTWLAWTQTKDATGRVRREWTPAGAVLTDPAQGGDAYDRAYAYDRANRLVTTYDRTSASGDLPTDPDTPGTLTAACTSRSYAFDKNGNRTIYAEYPANGDGTCQTTTGATSTKFHAYDTADRNTVASGYAYDTFGRATTIPIGDAPATGTSAGPSGGALTLGYYDTDATRTIAQNGKTTTYTLDPTRRRLTATTAPTGGGTATATMTRHYTDGGDNPGWVDDTTTGVTTRYAESLGGGLSAQAVTWLGATNVQVALTTLHGDVIATTYIPATGNTRSIDAWSDYTEYGTPRDPTAARAISGQTGYGWIGAKQRGTDPGTGLTLMGARLYNPTTGRFTTTDPVMEGNENAYNYPNDPLNMCDATGRAKWECRVRCHKVCNGASVGYVEGFGAGKTESEAVKAAKKHANDSVSRGCHARHCKPIPGMCSKNRFVKASPFLSRWHTNLSNRANGTHLPPTIIRVPIPVPV